MTPTDRTLRKVLSVLQTAYDSEPEILTMLGFDQPLENLMAHLDNQQHALFANDEATLAQVERYEYEKDLLEMFD
jgi:hypothetical protein